MDKRPLPAWLFLLLLLLSSSLRAQRNPHPHFRHYGTEQGLPSPEVYCAFEDSRGYMWFGTDNGASRFDGYSFKNYGPQEGLNNNVVFDIKEDGKGRIWFGTMSGGVFIMEGDTILPYRYNHLVKQHEQRYHGIKLSYLQPEEETAYFSLDELGVMVIDSSGNDRLLTSQAVRSRLFVTFVGPPHSLFTTVVDRNRLTAYSQDNLNEAKNRSARFEFMSGSERKCIYLPISKQGNSTRNIRTKQLSSGHLLIHHNNRLYCLQEDSLLWHIPYDFGAEFKINEIVEKEDGAILFCLSEGNGLQVYRDVEALRKGEFDLYLSEFSVSNAIEDRQGGLWVTTQEQGVFYCTNLALLIYDSRFGFSADFVNAVAFKNDHELYAGCQNGAIYQVDIEKQQITGELTTYYGYHNHDLLYQPSRDLLWSNGAYWKNGHWNFVKWGRHAITGKRGQLRTSKLEKLHINTAGDLVGCSSTGFLSIDIENDSVRFNTLNIKGLRERTFAIHTDTKQRLWVGNTRGLFEFRDSQLISPGLDHPAFHHRVEDIHEYPDGTLVLGTKGYGVILWKDTSIVQITTQNGLASNMLEDVHVDENGILWAATLNGLSKINRRLGAAPLVRSFTMANGLPSNEIYQIKSYEGQVWLCTAGGLVRFREPPIDTISIRPILASIKVNNNLLGATANPRLAHHQNNLEFQFLGINYCMNGRIPYRYRLQYAAPWQYTQNRVANYPALPPGKYKFEVQSQNEDGYWSGSSTYSFTVLPPWWDSRWFRTLAGLVIVATGYGFYRYRIQQLRKENALQQQMAALEKSALQAQMNPHFTFNCLNSIQNFILQNDKKKAVEYLSRFARLVRHSLDASVQGQVTLEEEIALLDNYLALERERFNHRFDYEIEVAESLKGRYLHFPPMLIQPYVENAVIHGLSDKNKGGMIKIRFSEKGGAVLASIKDNGVGYRKSEQEQKQQRHKSVGMSITRKRLELLGADPEHSVQISPGGEGQHAPGTEVNILINVIAPNEIKT